MSATTDAENGLPERQPLGAPCRHCGSADTWVEWRVEAKPIGSFSLAGAQMKFSANRWPYAVCGGCGHASRGEPTSPIPPAACDCPTSGFGYRHHRHPCSRAGENDRVIPPGEQRS